ncbi:MAG TPA: protein kinase [Pyrinomonadaceae bacterium]|jgi:WD40 repeat protein/tRNA A-37 threonylcarbamoyl transferase component Bud32
MLLPDTRLKERYRILHEIGGGGFGYVYKAIDEVFGCSVAIKETREEVAREDKLRKAFEREAKLLRNLKHDSLPRVTDYFFHAHSQFLVMDFIEGEDLAARLAKRLRQGQGPFTCQELLPWADKILAALEYLHARPQPIIHRDIKPGNIKLTEDGEVYLLDFGLAKGVTGQMSTVIEGRPATVVPGFTREYAPLEQLQGTDTEPQSDLYALGATLYHLLTGHLPASATQRDEALQRGQGELLKPAHEVNPTVPLAVSEVISRALAVRWWERLGSAREMRAALKRACGEVTAAQPGPAAQLAPRPARPGPRSGPATLPLQQANEPSSPDNSEQPPPPVKTLTSGCRRLWLVAGLALVLAIGLGVGLRLAVPRWFAPAVATKHEPEGGELSLRKVLTDHKNDPSKHIWSVAFSRDGALAASASEDGTIILWDTKTWRPKFSPLTGHAGAVYSVSFSPDGETLASGGDDATIRLWDTQRGRQLPGQPPLKTDRPVLRVAFSPDGSLLASCGGKTPERGGEEIRLWEVRNGWKQTALERQAVGMYAIAFSPDGSTLASSGLDNKQLSLLMWDMRNGGRRRELGTYDQPITTLAFSADGKYLACGGIDTKIKIWLYQPQTKLRWIEIAPTEAHNSLITSIAFSPDNKTLASATSDATIRLWGVSAQTPTLLWKSQTETQASQWALAFSPDGRTLLTGGEDNTVRVWQ